MICLMIVLRTPLEIKDCQLYNKHCAPVEPDLEGHPIEFSIPLDNRLPDLWRMQRGDFKVFHASTLPGQNDECKNVNVPQPHRRIGDVIFLQNFESMGNSAQIVPQKLSDTPDSREGNADSEPQYTCTDQVTQSPNGYTNNSEGGWRVRICPLHACTMMVNAHVAACMGICARASQTFRHRLFKRVMNKFSKLINCQPLGGEFTVEVSVTCILDVVAVWPQQRIDYAWNWHINQLLTKRMLLEEAMAWLSTLGGAHSSLGEYYQHHAELAGQISMKQLRLAVEMGDPLTVARCHMFWAYSLLQRGHTRKAKVIVRRVHQLASTHCVRDTRLINMCLAAWSRLQHLHRVSRQRRRLAANNMVRNKSIPVQEKLQAITSVSHVSSVNNPTFAS